MIKVKEVIVFTISGKKYGIEIGGMQSLETFQEVQPLADAPDFILGTVEIRGAVIPVFDINRIIGLPAKKPDGQRGGEEEAFASQDKSGNACLYRRRRGKCVSGRGRGCAAGAPDDENEGHGFPGFYYPQGR